MAADAPVRKKTSSPTGIFRALNRVMGAGSAAVATVRIVLGGLGATADLAAAVASQLLPGHMIGLTGPLGVGKTTFARGLVAARSNSANVEPPREVPSPTFTLVQTYEMGAEALSHFDLYRLGGPQEVEELGLDDALDAGPVVVEWPDRLGHLIPENRLDITFAFGEADDTRFAILSGHGDWKTRLDEVLAKFNPEE